MKTYYHRTPGARFIMPDGRILTFSAGDGSFPTDDAEIQKELDKVANVPSSQVYTKGALVVPIEEKQVHAEVASQAVTAFNADKKVDPSAQTVAIPMPTEAKPSVAADPELAAKAKAAAEALAKAK